MRYLLSLLVLSLLLALPCQAQSYQTIWNTKKGGTGADLSGAIIGGILYLDGSTPRKVTDSSNFVYNGSQAVFNLVDSYGGLKIKGRSGGEASIALQPDTVSDGAAGQWIFYTNGSGLNNSHDFAVYDSELTAPVLFLESGTGYMGLNQSNPAYQLDVNGTFRVTGNVTLSGTGNSVGTITSGTWNGTGITNSYLATMADQTVKGNISGGSAVPSDLTKTQLTTLINPATDLLSGGVPATSTGKILVGKTGAPIQAVTPSGDVASVSDAGLITIAADAVSNAKLSDMATHTFKANITAGTDNPTDITQTQLTAEINLFSTSATTKGAVPGSNSVGATYFLNGSGAWSIPGFIGGTGTATQIPYFTASTTLASEAGSGANSLTWDATNNFMGIGQATPKCILHVGNNTTSGTVGAGAIILGVPESSTNIGVGAVIEGGAGGLWSSARGQNAHAEGYYGDALGAASHAEGAANVSSGTSSHAEGDHCTASNSSAHAEGTTCTASAPYAHAEGSSTTSTGNASHAEGYSNGASGAQSHAEGISCTAAAPNSHVEGNSCNANSGANDVHLEGASCTANTNGDQGHAEGQGCAVNAPNGHAQGYQCTVSGDGSNFAGGALCNATAGAAFVHGISSTAGGHCSAVLGHSASDGNNAGCFVANDDTGTATTASTTNEMRVQFVNGFHQVLTPNYWDGTVTTVAGSTSGNLYWSQPERGTGYKKVVISLAAFNDSGETVTFSTAFAHTPSYILGSGLTVTPTSVSTTTIVLPATAGETGTIIIEGI